jgi:hypothetical protein
MTANARPNVRERVLPNKRVIVVVHMMTADDAEQADYAERVYKVIKSQLTPFAVIIDMRDITDYPATQRQLYADVRERLRDVYARLHRLTVYVVKSDYQRGIVTAVGWKAQASATSGRTFTDDLADAHRLCEAALKT